MIALPTASSGEWRTHPSEWEGTQTPRRERHAHRWPSMVRGAVLALPMRSFGERRTHSSEWGNSDAQWPSMVRGAMLARPTRRATYHRALGSRELILQNERELRHSEGSGMLIGDPQGEGSNASSTDSELWGAENSSFRMRENSDAHEGSGKLIGDSLWWGEQC